MNGNKYKYFHLKQSKNIRNEKRILNILKVISTKLKLVQVFLFIQNIFRIKGESPNDVLSEIKEKYPEANEFNLSEVLEKNGYNEIYFKNWDKGEIYSVFMFNQIKSATNNIGTFSTMSDSIYESI